MIGFIGLGIMGLPMARNILRSDQQLVVHSRSQEPVARLANEGALTATSAAEIAARADVIVTMLPDDQAVDNVIRMGIVESGALRPGTLIVDMSTISPASAIRLASAIQAGGGAFVDAPVSGGEPGAIAGTLSIMAGGDAADIAGAQPVFQAVGDRVVHVGPVGAGQLAKACNQLVVLATIEVVAEALVLAELAGIDPRRVHAAMLGGLASSKVLESLGQRMLDRDFLPGGRAAFHAKDIEIIRETAARTGATVPAFSAAAANLEQLLAEGGGDLDHSAIFTVLDRAARRH